MPNISVYALTLVARLCTDISNPMDWMHVDLSRMTAVLLRSANSCMANMQLACSARSFYRLTKGIQQLSNSEAHPVKLACDHQHGLVNTQSIAVQVTRYSRVNTPMYPYITVVGTWLTLHGVELAQQLALKPPHPLHTP